MQSSISRVSVSKFEGRPLELKLKFGFSAQGGEAAAKTTEIYSIGQSSGEKENF